MAGNAERVPARVVQVGVDGGGLQLRWWRTAARHRPDRSINAGLGAGAPRWGLGLGAGPARIDVTAHARARRARVVAWLIPPQNIGRTASFEVGFAVREGRDPAQRRRRDPRRAAAVPGGAGLRGHGPAPARERRAGRPRHHLPRRAGPGQDPHDPPADRACSTSGCRSWPAREINDDPYNPVRRTPRP